MRVEFEILDTAGMQPGDPLGPHRRHAVLVLQHAVDQQERFVGDDEAIADEEIRPDDVVRVGTFGHEIDISPPSFTHDLDRLRRALMTLARALPGEFPAPVVVVLHVGAESPSVLPQQ